MSNEELVSSIHHILHEEIVANEQRIYERFVNVGRNPNSVIPMLEAAQRQLEKNLARLSSEWTTQKGAIGEFKGDVALVQLGIEQIRSRLTHIQMELIKLSSSSMRLRLSTSFADVVDAEEVSEINKKLLDISDLERKQTEIEIKVDEELIMQKQEIKPLGEQIKSMHRGLSSLQEDFTDHLNEHENPPSAHSFVPFDQ